MPGVQLTWMDAKVGDHVVTPRIGKPVEVQALWINALRIAERLGAALGGARRRAPRQRSRARFPDPATGGLFDVVDVDHVAGTADAKLRPNQIFAVGGLPFPVLDGDAARGVVDLVEAQLLTPLGPAHARARRSRLRRRITAAARSRATAPITRAPSGPGCSAPSSRPGSRVRGGTAAAKAEARARFLPPLLAHLETAGLGHVSEVADGDPPHTPGGCPFQAWSLGELIRIQRMLA